MYLGVDLGTSSVKAVVIDDEGAVHAEQSAPLTRQSPSPLWSEQDPDDWVTAAEAAVSDLPAEIKSRVTALGLSGQMHGATLLGDDDRPLRPAILWNDGRAHAECADLEASWPELRAVTGNKAMPGFTAPKLLWVRYNEPELFSKIAHVLLPKDYLRLVWTGEAATDVSDASGTLWLDVGNRRWSEDGLLATGLDISHMPVIVEGPDETGQLRAEVANRLGLPSVPVVGGGGDQAAGAVGAGVVGLGETSLALGTSGVMFTVTDGFQPNPDDAVHAFCHAVPGMWHQMAVILSAASAIDKAASLTGFDSPGTAYNAAAEHGSSDGVLFLPYLSGERTPHDDPHARGAFGGITNDTAPAALVHAALEGVAFAFADGLSVLRKAGANPKDALVIGGGARSSYWGQLLADTLDLPLIYREGAATGPAQGAARLAQAGVTKTPVKDLPRQEQQTMVVEPRPTTQDAIQDRYARWQRYYHATKDLWTAH